MPTDKAKILAPILAERRAHLARLPGMTDHGLEVIMHALSGEPVRTPSGGPATLVTRAAMRKSPLSNDAESQFEFEALFTADADPDVIDIRTQAITLTVHPVEVRPDGTTRNRGFQIKPDQLLIRRSGRPLLRDLMREDELNAIIEARPWFMHRDAETGRVRCPSAEAAADAICADHEIVSSKGHSRLTARGLRYLWDFVDVELDPAAVAAIAENVAANPGITIEELIREGSALGAKGWSVDHALAAVAQHIVFLDLRRFTPSDHAHARLYRDAATARAYEHAHAPSWAAGGARPARADIRPGTKYAMGTRNLELYLCLGDEVQMVESDVPGCPVRTYARGDFERLVATGGMVPVAAERLEDVARKTARAMWAAAGPKRRATALARFRAVEVFRANREARKRQQPLVPVPLVGGSAPSKASLERFHAASEKSLQTFGDPLVGLLPAVRKGRPGDRLSGWVEEVIQTQVKSYYETGVGRSKKATIDRIRETCEARNRHEVPDRKTIRERIARGDPYKTAKAHDGSKAAYVDKPYLPIDADSMPTRGEYPFQRCQYDTSIADVRVLDPTSGRDLGRPTTGLLVDSYSDKALVRGWGFGARPKVGDLLDVLVECAETYGRLPEELILDHASSHWAAALQVFGMANSMHITYRPIEQGRFGGPVEIGFGRLTKVLLHNLQGNTKAARLVRMLTDETDPEKLAILSLPELDYLVDLFDQAEDSTRIVKERGLTPNDAFARGLIEHGAREKRHVVVDDLFRVQAIVPAGKRTSQGAKGVELDNLSYQHDCFRHHGVKGEEFDVGRHHRDVTRIWAFVPAHRCPGGPRIPARWVEARCGLLARLRFVSEHELAIATRIVRERLSDDNRKRVVREKAIAEVLMQASVVEELATERMRSIALGEVSLVLPASTPPSLPDPIDSAPIPAPVQPREGGPSGNDDPVAAALREIEAARYSQPTETD